MKGFNPGKGTGMSSAFKSNGDLPVDDKTHYGGMLDEIKLTDKYPSGKSKRLAEERKIKEKLYENPVIKSVHGSTDKAAKVVKQSGSEAVQAFFPFAGIIGKGSKVVKGVKGVKKLIPKKLPHYGKMDSQKTIDKVINVTKSRGKMYDDVYTKKPWKWSSKNFTKVPSVSGREMIDLNVKGLPPQRFYKSTGLGGKNLKSGQSSKGKWVPLEGFGSRPGVKDWFIKSKGWDEGYGSKLFKDIDLFIDKFAK